MKRELKKLFWITLIVITVILSCHVSKVVNAEPYKVESIGLNRSKIIFNDSTSFEVDKVLLRDVKDYINDIILYEGLDYVEYQSRTYMGIYMDVVPYGSWGVTYMQHPYGDDYTLVSPFVRDAPRKIRTIVYHELHHKFGLVNEHCHKFCAEVMSSELTQISFYSDWENQKKVLFLNKKHDSIKINAK